MSEPSTPLLSPAQRRVVAAALTLLAFLASLALVTSSIWVLGRLASAFAGVIWPLAAAGVLALLLRPLVSRLQALFGLGRSAAVMVLYGATVVALAGAFFLLLPPLVDQVLALVAYAPTLWDSVTGYLQQHYPQWKALIDRQLGQPGVQGAVDSLGVHVRGLLAGALPSLRVAFGGMVDLAGFIAHLAIVPVYLFFFLLLRGGGLGDLERQLPFLRPHVRADIVFLAREFLTIVEAFFRGQLLIGLTLGAVLAVGFSLVGLKFGLILGLALGLLNIVPYLGSILGLLVALPLAFFQPDGGWRLLGLVVAVKVAAQCLEAWVLTPRIMGQRTGLHPMLIIVAVFFWGTAFGGVLGMLLAVPLTAFFVTAWRLARHKYLGGGDAG